MFIAKKVKKRIKLRSSTCACGAPPNMKMGLRIVASIINISFDGRPPVSLGTAVVDLLTIIPCSSDEMLGSVLCARKAHLFSEQERNRFACLAKVPLPGFAPNGAISLGVRSWL